MASGHLTDRTVHPLKSMASGHLKIGTRPVIMLATQRHTAEIVSKNTLKLSDLVLSKDDHWQQ